MAQRSADDDCKQWLKKVQYWTHQMLSSSGRDVEINEQELKSFFQNYGTILNQV